MYGGRSDGLIVVLRVYKILIMYHNERTKLNQ